MNGSQILAQALQRQGVDTFFYIMGAPMLSVEAAALALGLRGIDVRHEQAAAMAAHAYARLRNRPGVCMAASGPGTTNLVTGVAHAWADGTPGRGARRLGAGERERARHLPGDRPARDDGALHQVGGPGAPGASASPSSIDRAIRARDERQARPGLSRPARRRALRRGRRGGGRLARALGSGDAAAPGGGRGRDRAPRRAAGGGRAAGGRLRQRRPVVRGRGELPALRRGRRHPVLHHAAGPRRDPRGSPALPISAPARWRSARPT